MKKIFLIIFIILIVGVFYFVFFKSKKTANIKTNNLTASETVKEEVKGEVKYHAISIPAYAEKTYDGRDLKLGKVLAETSVYTRYYITYKSGELTISGILNVPKGVVPEGGWPVLFLNHGHIDTEIYTNGRGLKREQDYLASRGYAVLHSDYRNHAESDKDGASELTLRLAYVEDVINAVEAVKNSKFEYLSKEKFGMLGHSMGGGIAQNIAVIKPDLVKSIVLFAPVSMMPEDSFERWTKSRPEIAQKIIEVYGSPTSSPEFWANASAINFLDRISIPLLYHHGTADADVPLDWSEKTVKALEEAGKEVIFNVYEGQPHEFTTDWPLVMQRTLEFFNQTVK